jgi:hypothetical protein
MWERFHITAREAVSVALPASKRRGTRNPGMTMWRRGARSVLAFAMASTIVAACTLEDAEHPPADTAGSAGVGASATHAGMAGATASGAGTSSTGGQDSTGGKDATGGSSSGETAGAGVSAGGRPDLNSGGATTGGASAGTTAAGTAGGNGAATCKPACTGGSVCNAGECRCQGSLSYCEGSCVDTQTEADDCGGCGKPCAAPRVCSVGACKCPNGGAYCGSACVDTQTDSNNCGSCGTACQGAAECINGACKACSTGCAVLTTAVTKSSANPYVGYGIKLSAPINLVGATVKARLYVASSLKPVAVQIHYDDTSDLASSGAYVSTTVPASGWFEAEGTGIADISFSNHVDLIEVTVGGFAANGTSVIYLDSITITPAVGGPWTFSASASPLVYSLTDDVDPTAISGVITWRNN